MPFIGNKARDIMAFLLSEQAAGRVPIASDIARKFDCSKPYVHTTRAEMVRNGQLPAPPRGSGMRKILDSERLDVEARRRARLAIQRATKPIAAEFAAAGREVGLSLTQPLKDFREEQAALDAALSDGSLKAMTTEQRRVFLSEVAKRTGRDEIKVSAVAALNRLDASLRTSDDVGPRNPLTIEEADDRIADLQRARSEVFGSSAPDGETDMAPRDGTPALG